MTNLVPHSYWRLPTLTNLWEDDDEWNAATNWPSGLSISEDEKHVYIQAAVPGVEPKDIEVTVDHGIAWIKGETKNEESSRKFHRKAVGSFSYRVAVPGDIDPNTDPDARVRNGVMTLTFSKSPKAQPKKISVQEEK